MSNPNPTHSVLYNYDLLYEIIDYVQPLLADTDYTRKIGLMTLARLSRVCKLFLEPSLDGLWGNQNSIYPTILVLHAIEDGARSQVRLLKYDPAVTQILQS